MNAVAEETKSVSLYYREGSSDKEYHARIEPKDDGYVVNFAYGRRGSSLSTGTKTSSPIEYEEAVKVFEKLVREKKAKGYTESENGSTFSHTEKAGQKTELLPQLLNPVDEKEVSRLVSSEDWWMQEKKDGKRIILRKQNGVIEGINRKGLIVSIPPTIEKTATELPGDFVMDGECIGDHLHAFDLLFLRGEDLRQKSYKQRHLALFNLLASGLPKHIKWVNTWTEPIIKAEQLKLLMDAKAEGVVFKRPEAPYTPGRPNSGGTQVKHKFYATLSAVVSGINKQRSVGLRLLNQDGWQPVGNVTIPPNQRIPNVGAVVEIRYLYAYPNGCLYQPTYLGERTDIDAEECLLNQVKFKPEDDEG